jgi:hypothetical protein
MVGLSSLSAAQKRGLAILGGTAAVSGIALGAAVVASRRKKKRSAAAKRSRKARNRSKARKSYRRTPYTAGKRKDTSRRRIRYTKNGQPYVILASGKARFIKKKTAKTARKRKGGKY